MRVAEPRLGKKPLLAAPLVAVTVPAMSTVQEIESAIEKLPDHDVAEIRSWLWERDIERDAAAGRLDKFADEALREHRTGKTRRL